MDKYFLIMGFQLTQMAFLQAIDGAVWRAFREHGVDGVLGSMNANAPGMLFEALLSGTWIGRVAEIGSLALTLGRGIHGLPLTLMLSQWLLVLLWFAAERAVLARRLQRIAVSK